MASESKNIVITGAAQGIGRCIARWLLQKGHRLFLIDIKEDELTYTATQHLKTHSSRLSYAVCNLRDVQAIRDTISKAASYFNDRIDVLVQNGSIASPKWKDDRTMMDPSTIEEWNAYVETNLTAPFAVAQACLPYMRSPNSETAQHLSSVGPSMILIGSFRAHQSDPNQEGYAATKAGQLGLMHSMAISLSQWGIRVNSVAPGRIKATYESQEGDEKGAEWGELNEKKDEDDHPTNRAGKPEDIAQAVEYFIGAGFVTGQELVVDGGATKKKST